MEKVHLKNSIAQMQHNRRLCAEPGVQTRQTRQLVPFTRRNVGAGLQQMFAHIGTEVAQQRHLLLQRRRVAAHHVVMLGVVLLRVLNLSEIFL